MHLVRYLTDKVENIFFKNQWRLIFFNKEDELGIKLNEYQNIIPPKDRFYADPFPVYHKNKLYIFFEEMLFNQKNAFLSVLSIDSDCSISIPKKILEEKFHLSYPFIIYHDNEYFMIPETASNNKISLYKCDSFHKIFCKHLMHNVKAVDTTVFYYNDYFWMFTNLAESEGCSTWDELFLFF